MVSMPAINKLTLCFHLQIVQMSIDQLTKYIMLTQSLFDKCVQIIIPILNQNAIQNDQIMKNTIWNYRIEIALVVRFISFGFTLQAILNIDLLCFDVIFISFYLLFPCLICYYFIFWLMPIIFYLHNSVEFFSNEIRKFGILTTCVCALYCFQLPTFAISLNSLLH